MRQSLGVRKGIIPDLLLRAFNDLFDVKGQTLSNTFLQKSGFRKAVNAKENGVNPNYRRRAHAIDCKYNGWRGARFMGPLCRFLMMHYGKVTGLAFGPHGVGDQVEALVSRIAKGTAELQWRQMGARSVKEATGVFKHAIRCEIGIHNTRLLSQLVFDRVGIMLNGGFDKSAYSRKNERVAAEAEHEYWTRHGGWSNAGAPQRGGD